MDTKTQKLCECGCGNPAPIATRNWHTKGIKKGQPLRFICGHHRRGQKQSRKEKAKRVRSWGRKADFSPYLENKIVRYASDQKRWYCANPRKISSTIPHAKAVYEHFYEEVPKGYAVHHINGCCKNLEDDRPDNLIVVTRKWNWRFFPDLAEGFVVSESVVTQFYIESINEGIEEKGLFQSICRKLITHKESP